MTERFEFTVAQLPALGAHLLTLPQTIGGRTALPPGRHRRGRPRSPSAIAPADPEPRPGAVPSTAWPARRRCAPSSARCCSTRSPWWRWPSPAGWCWASSARPTVSARKLGQMVLHALVYWRGFNLVFRAFLRPAPPEGRIAPVDDGTARRLLVALDLVILLPLLGQPRGAFLEATGANREMIERRHHPLRAGDRSAAGRSGLALAPRHGGLADRHGAADRLQPPAQARRGAQLVDGRPRLLRAAWASRRSMPR